MKTLTMQHSTWTRKRVFSVTLSWLTAGAVFLSLCNNWLELAKGVNPAFFSKPHPIHLGYSEAQKTIENAHDMAMLETQEIFTGTKNGEVGKYRFLESVNKTEPSRATIAFRQANIKEQRSYIESKIEEIKAQKKLKSDVKAQIASITCDPSDITKHSNLTLEQIELLVEGTWLEGEELTIYKADTEGGINAFFCIAIATLESGYGTSPRSLERSNFYGLETTTDYQSYKNCTEYFTDMMHRLYISNPNIGSDINQIGPIYCPPNPEWASIVTDMAMTRYNTIMELTKN